MAKRPYSPSPLFLTICGLFFAVSLLLVTLPHVAVYAVNVPATLPPFPVGVDPKNKQITSQDGVLSFAGFSLAAAVVGVTDATQVLAAAIMSTKSYERIAGSGTPTAVVITPGMRKEQVAGMLEKSFHWSKDQRQIFLEAASTTGSGGEGMLYPSTYVFAASTTPAEAYTLIKERFDARVLSRYSTSTHEIVPLDDTLTIASIIEREAGTTAEMRVISGILWNRLFAGMRLQADSTLSYARGTARNGWWPVPRSKDKYINSPYNTYKNEGLPPGPIASPSVPAIMAALNPEKTECVFFFHAKGQFYCHVTYEEHVAALKKIYGRGR